MELHERQFACDSLHANELIENIKLKQRLLEDGDSSHSAIKTALIIGAGAMRGVYSGGVIIALNELGLTETFDDVIGISAGAASAAYFLSDQAALGTSIYYEELNSKKFVRPFRFGNVLDIEYLGDVFTSVKPLDEAAVRSNRSNFYIGVTNLDTVESEYIDIGNATDKDMIKFIKASSSVPGLSPAIEIDGVHYGDGITTCRNPIAFAIDTLGATDVLYVTNQPLRKRRSISLRENLMARIATRNYAPEVTKAYINRHTMSDESLSTTYVEDVHIGILGPLKAPVGRLTRNATRLQRAAEQGRTQTLDAFA